MLANALKARKARLNDEKGFTLIELLAVIVILAIIAVIAIPLIGNIINNAKQDADVATAKQVYDASRLYVIGEKEGDFTTATTADNSGQLVIDITALKNAGYLDAKIVLPSSKKEITGGNVTYKDGQLLSVTLTTADGNKSYTADKVLASNGR